MGTWGVGPFDNDFAADWADDFGELGVDERPEALRQALRAVTDREGYLDSDYAVEGIAAAAVVAHARTGVLPSGDVPAFLAEEGAGELPGDLDRLAARALTRVLADGSEWRELWEESGRFDAARGVLDQLRSGLRAGD